MMTVGIDSPPRDYGGWADCLRKLSEGFPDEDFIGKLSAGSCPGYDGIKEMFNKRVEDAVNAVIANCIKEFRRDIARLTETNEIEGFHLAFIRFAKRLELSMFFTRIPFLDAEFTRALAGEIYRQVSALWNSALAALESEAAEKDNSRLLEELFLIRRIRLFNDHRAYTDIP